MKKSWLSSLVLAAAAMLLDYLTRGPSWLLLVYLLWVPVLVIEFHYLNAWASKRKSRQRWVPFLAVALVLVVGAVFQGVVVVATLLAST
ncbi:hypothetical protein [Pseudomonas aeruginosa]|uniref:hypothetical protein n=1 Tax=Pseudomonas aeruginosa TaxID=287 RepID=UPI00287FD61D|nr:hypothetical protein [Pseudomonas aeruginosa]